MALEAIKPVTHRATVRCIAATDEYALFSAKPRKSVGFMFSIAELAPFGYQPRMQDRVQFVTRTTHLNGTTHIVEIVDVRLRERGGLKVVK